MASVSDAISLTPMRGMASVAESAPSLQKGSLAITITERGGYNV